MIHTIQIIAKSHLKFHIKNRVKPLISVLEIAENLRQMRKKKDKTGVSDDFLLVKQTSPIV